MMSRSILFCLFRRRPIVSTAQSGILSRFWSSRHPLMCFPLRDTLVYLVMNGTSLAPILRPALCAPARSIRPEIVQYGIRPPPRCRETGSNSMRNLLITMCLLAVFLEVSGLIFSAKREGPSEVFRRLGQTPAVRLESPLQNGYFLLLGLTTDSAADPVQVGYEIWLEAEAHRGNRHFDLVKGERASLRITISPDVVVPEWSVTDPVRSFQEQGVTMRTSMTRYAVLLGRYRRWLTMSLEDWGFGHPASPRFTEILAVHRLFIGEGFAQSVTIGASRLQQDTIAWRRVLADAKTIPMKIMAVTMLDDNLSLLSKALITPDPDPVVVTTARQIGHALTHEESAMRWPIQNEFALGLARRKELLSVENFVGADEADLNRQWLAHAAGLHSDAFTKVQHPAAQTVFGMTLETQGTWDAYATYYDALITSSAVLHSPLPHLHEVTEESHRTLFEQLLNPIGFDPSWESFTQRLLATDAKLRLIALQVIIRGARDTEKIAERISQAGPEYFDPFSGLPMLWSQSHRRLYSVGKDGLDDDGDTTFDIVTPSLPEPGRPGVATERDRPHRARHG